MTHGSHGRTPVRPLANSARVHYALPMLILMSGSSAAGKTAVGPHVSRLVANLVFHDVDEPREAPDEDRLQALAYWMDRALEYSETGTDLLLASQSPFGELLACPNAIGIDAAAGCVLDCSDLVRATRIRARGHPHDQILGMDILCWAVFHRMHASDPQFEQRVICDNRAASTWSRWTSWTAEDPRWAIPVFDTSITTIHDTAHAIADWIARVRHDPPIQNERQWWR